MSDFWKLVRRFAGFSASSLLGTAVDMFVLWICSHYLLEGEFAEYYLSPFISFEFAVLTNFTFAYYFVWKDRISHRSARSFFRHYGGYNASCTLVFLVKMGFLALFHHWFPSWDVLICNIVALCCSGAANFLMNELVVFRKKKD